MGSTAAPIGGVVSCSSIDEEVVFPKLPCAQRPRQTYTLVVVIIVPPIEGFPPLGTLEDAERRFRGVWQLLQSIPGGLASLKPFR